jgi:hypothetical protein
MNNKTIKIIKKKLCNNLDLECAPTGACVKGLTLASGTIRK